MAIDSQDILEEIEPLLRAVIPAAVLCVEQPKTQASEIAARKAVIDAVQWFLPGVDTSPLVGFELSYYAGNIILNEHLKPAAAHLPEHRFDGASGSVPMLIEHLYAVQTGAIHRSGSVSSWPLTRKSSAELLRGTIQNLIRSAVYALDGDPFGMYRGQGRVPGLELDLEGLLVVLAEDFGERPNNPRP